ncbi:hypothetical protein ABK040_007037 [Willaertia magna]
MEAYIHQIKGLFVLDKDGKRLFAKYYTPDLKHNLSKQMHLEEDVASKTIKSKTHQLMSDCDILLIENYNCIFQTVQDICFYVIGAGYENEIVLSEVLTGLVDGLLMLFRNQLEKRTLLENFDLIVLAFDEVIEDGIIIETDSTVIAQKVASIESGSSSNPTEETDALTQAFRAGKEQVSELLSSFFQF